MKDAKPLVDGARVRGAARRPCGAGERRSLFGQSGRHDSKGTVGRAGARLEFFRQPRTGEEAKSAQPCFSASPSTPLATATRCDSSRQAAARRGHHVVGTICFIIGIQCINLSILFISI